MAPCIYRSSGYDVDDFGELVEEDTVVTQVRKCLQRHFDWYIFNRYFKYSLTKTIILPFSSQVRKLDSSYCGSLRRYDDGRKRRLPARIVLRPLASYKLLSYLAIAYLFLYLLCQKSLISSSFHIFVAYILFVATKAMVEWIDWGDGHKMTGEKIKETLDMTLEATTFSQDESF